jgi:hypothetical protein
VAQPVGAAVVEHPVDASHPVHPGEDGVVRPPVVGVHPGVPVCCWCCCGSGGDGGRLLTEGGNVRIDDREVAGKV